MRNYLRRLQPKATRRRSPRQFMALSIFFVSFVRIKRTGKRKKNKSAMLIWGATVHSVQSSSLPICWLYLLTAVLCIVFRFLQRSFPRSSARHRAWPQRRSMVSRYASNTVIAHLANQCKAKTGHWIQAAGEIRVVNGGWLVTRCLAATVTATWSCAPPVRCTLNVWWTVILSVLMLSFFSQRCRRRCSSRSSATSKTNSPNFWSLRKVTRQWLPTISACATPLLASNRIGISRRATAC